MSAENVIQSLEKLLQLHKKLYEITLQKTELLKSEDVEALREMLKKEQMFVKAISQVENERIKHTTEYLQRDDDLTLSACIEKAVGEEKDRLVTISSQLKETIEALKQSNHLNRELTKQALQLTNLTLDMIMPQEKDYNYNSKPANTQVETKRRSLFDSQA
ncbi:flagellar protein FlgN [Metabacillus malikii]|uniref:Flagellar biosynthesis/type III secretory pathway chaperone n=1 Tax=Metabacillus malikii TaxID=1504265 RepID=A0ABT9ZGQ4_9BACI|nr:flagellar protein FlgN [Metabacillus malikii]MDQ0231451.1 flagellar biosynthesis/type III secretory pathway chaperone [Metabacillus malikii]